MPNQGHPLYITIPYPIFVDQKLTPAQKLILAEILSLLQIETRYCWAANPHFANQLHISRHTVSSAIQKLRATGYIQFINYGTQPCPMDDCPLRLKGNHRHIVPESKSLTALAPLVQNLDKARRNIAQGLSKKPTQVTTRSTHSDKETARFLELKATRNKTDREVREYMSLSQTINARTATRH